jgi:hypothetical protein
MGERAQTSEERRQDLQHILVARLEAETKTGSKDLDKRLQRCHTAFSQLGLSNRKPLVDQSLPGQHHNALIIYREVVEGVSGQVGISVEKALEKGRARAPENAQRRRNVHAGTVKGQGCTNTRTIGGSHVQYKSSTRREKWSPTQRAFGNVRTTVRVR